MFRINLNPLNFLPSPRVRVRFDLLELVCSRRVAVEVGRSPCNCFQPTRPTGSSRNTRSRPGSTAGTGASRRSAGPGSSREPPGVFTRTSGSIRSPRRVGIVFRRFVRFSFSQKKIFTFSSDARRRRDEKSKTNDSNSDRPVAVLRHVRILRRGVGADADVAVLRPGDGRDAPFSQHDRAQERSHKRNPKNRQKTRRLSVKIAATLPNTMPIYIIIVYN